MSESLYSWYNFRTGEYDHFRTTDDTDLRDYVPYPAGAALYEIYTTHKGLSNINAVIKILEITNKIME